MLARRWSSHVGALLIFSALAVAFAWPLPLHLSTHLTGPVEGDAGVYVWNQWVFRHELLEHRSFPYFTGKIFSLTAPANLSLHNYTTFANILALPLTGVLGVVATFNIVYLLTIVMSAYAMFLLARHVTQSDAEAALAGILFAWSPVLVTRGMGHYSLVAAAPLPLFLLLLMRAEHQWRIRDGVLLGCVMGWAATTDVYYAAFCLLIAAAFGWSHLVRVRRAGCAVWYAPVARVLEVLIVSMMGLVLALAVSRGWRITFLGATISMRSLYTPVLVLLVLTLARIGLRYRPAWPRIQVPDVWRLVRVATLASVVTVLILSPVLYALGYRFAQGRLDTDSRTFWRSSPSGVDLVAFFVPNPNHPLVPQIARDWLTPRPERYVENVASVPLVALGVLVAAWRRGWRPPRIGLVVTLFFGLLALGPFIHVGGLNTYVPGPWALLRYVPLIGLARMPSRFTVLVILGVAVLFARALHDLGRREPRVRPWLIGCVAVLLVAELFPVPRPLFAATVPSFYHRIAADSRDVRVLELPFGVRDGTKSIGNFTARSQFYQTVHQKPLIGGYLSRVSRKRIKEIRSNRVLDVLIRLSANRNLPVGSPRRSTRGGKRFIERAKIGYVVIDRNRASEALVEFAMRTFCLELIERDHALELYRPQ